MNKNTRNRLSLVVIPVIALAAVALYAVQGKDTADGALLRPDDKGLQQQGGEIYAQNCASCHGADLEGEADWRTANPDGTLRAPPHDETGHTWHHADELLFRITKFGTAKAAGLTDYQSNMPGFEGVLSDEEIVAVLSWIKAQWPAEVRERHDMMNERAREAKQ
jgi:mono/diheme cytochrome c family protein